MSRWPVYSGALDRLGALQQALDSLKDVQERVRMAGAPYTLLKIQAARRSLEGAIRHAEGRTNDRPRTRHTTTARRPRRLA